ncbi:DUF4214 domain-containing protein [Undibacterium sp. JH2W]|uniref:DUF4214 domain-containing protein n=1 Tax=Undibacterium sp. JH2W TaxID=3413037 RepID=UPI003BF22886
MARFDAPSDVIFKLPSTDYRINALLSNPAGPFIWSGHTITYSFPSGSAYFPGGTNYGQGQISAGWFPLSAAQQTAVRDALAAWAAVADLHFVEVDDGLGVGQLRFAFSNQVTGNVLGEAYQPSTSPSAGDIWLNPATANQSFEPKSPTLDNTATRNFHTLLHEIGHALGLSHPFVLTGENRTTAPLPSTENKPGNTVMTYEAHPYNAYSSTPMLYDILAIQSLYGPNKNNHTGDDVYTFNTPSRYLGDWQNSDFQYITIWDAGGNDTIAASNYSKTSGSQYASSSQPVGIDLREGHFSNIGYATPNQFFNRGDGLQQELKNLDGENVYIAFGTVIENAIGSDSVYGDSITGNAANNVITGRFGGDYIDGGDGIDTSVYEGNYLTHVAGSSRTVKNYTITQTATGMTVEDLVNVIPVGHNLPPNIDHLTNIERLRFPDISIAFDIKGAAGEAYRLYQAAFNREPDLIGIGYWIGALDRGETLTSVANNFIISPEFKTLYGSNPSNTTFLTNLYQNILHRAPDQVGYNYWLDELNRGIQTKATLLVSFSESPENQAQIIGKITDGIFYQPYGL